MKLRTALTLAALASLMAFPFGASAQGRGGQQDKGKTQNSRSDNKDLGRGGQQNSKSNSNQNRGGDKQNNRGNDRNNGGSQDRGRGGDGNESGNGRNSGNKGDENRSKGNDNRGRSNDWNQRDNDRDNIHRYPPVSNWNNDRSSHRFYRSDHDDWRDIAFIGGFFAQINFLTNDDRICFSGSAGDYYPIWQYDQDMDSRDLNIRARAEFFDHDFFYRDGHRYERRTVMHNGERCYQFIRD